MDAGAAGVSVPSAAAEPAGDRLRQGLERFIEHQAGSPVSILGLFRGPGGTLRHAWAVDVEIARGPVAGRRRLIYLQDRGGAPLESRLPRGVELRVIAAMHAAGVRVPKPYWEVGKSDASDVGTGLILERVEGEAVGRRLLQDAAFAGVRPRLLDQMGEELARIHAIRADAVDDLPRPASGRAPAQVQLDEIEHTLRQIDEPHPALELALRWLRQRVPRRERLVIVHGDYRLGNVIADPEHGLRAVLDWELSHLGDPGEDLGWACIRFWRCVDHPGEPGLGPRQRFFDAYAAVSGERLDADRALYWEIFANFRWAVVTLRQAWRHLSGREKSLELASLGRRCAEVEWEIMDLLESR